MATRIHGVLGGPRQKISPPRTKVDITNKIEIEDTIEAIIVSSKGKELVSSKLEEEPKPEEPIEEVKPKKSSKKRTTKRKKKSKAKTEEKSIDSTVQNDTNVSVDDWLLKLSSQGDESI